MNTSRPATQAGFSFVEMMIAASLLTAVIAFVANAVVAGVGLGLLPTFLVRDHLAAGTIVRVLPRVTVAAGALYLAYPPTKHVPRKVSALRDFLVEHFARHPLTASSASS